MPEVERWPDIMTLAIAIQTANSSYFTVQPDNYEHHLQP